MCLEFFNTDNRGLYKLHFALHINKKEMHLQTPWQGQHCHLHRKLLD